MVPNGRCLIWERSNFAASNFLEPCLGRLLLFKPSGMGSAASRYSLIKNPWTFSHLVDGARLPRITYRPSYGQNSSPFLAAPFRVLKRYLPMANIIIKARLHTGFPKNRRCRDPRHACWSWAFKMPKTLAMTGTGDRVCDLFTEVMTSNLTRLKINDKFKIEIGKFQTYWSFSSLVMEAIRFRTFTHSPNSCCERKTAKHPAWQPHLRLIKLERNTRFPRNGPLHPEATGRHSGNPQTFGPWSRHIAFFITQLADCTKYHGVGPARHQLNRGDDDSELKGSTGRKCLTIVFMTIFSFVGKKTCCVNQHRSSAPGLNAVHLRS